MLIPFYGLCLALTGYCGLYAAYCFQKGKAGEGVGAGVLALMAAAASALLMVAV